MSQAAVSEARVGARCRRWCYYREDGPESGLGSLARALHTTWPQGHADAVRPFTHLA